MPEPESQDPELVAMDELRRIEQARGRSDRRVRRGSAALILSAVLVIIALAAAAAWVIARA